jgi:hypothetical protein
MSARRSFLDVQSPIFRPLWLRVGIVVSCLGWAVIELSSGAVFWAALFGAAGLYLAYQFLVAFNPPDPEKTEDKP